MTAVNYTMVTVATVAPEETEATLERVSRLAADLREKAGAASLRYGVIATGNFSGKLVLFQGYEGLGGIERAFEVYARSSAYREIVSTPSLRIDLRNILKLEQIGLSAPSQEMPAYGVVTRFGAADMNLEGLRALVPVFERNGAMMLRYGTFITGSDVGRRLVGVGYPSMEAIEKTYRELNGTEAYRQFMSKVDLDWRNIIRFEG